VFKFLLKDKDGFELLGLNSKEENLTSGRSNRFQAKAEEPVLYPIAIKTKSIE
jgi:hypothetical protein